MRVKDDDAVSADEARYVGEIVDGVEAETLSLIHI